MFASGRRPPLRSRLYLFLVVGVGWGVVFVLSMLLLLFYKKYIYIASVLYGREIQNIIWGCRLPLARGSLTRMTADENSNFVLIIHTSSKSESRFRSLLVCSCDVIRAPVTSLCLLILLVEWGWRRALAESSSQWIEMKAKKTFFVLGFFRPIRRSSSPQDKPYVPFFFSFFFSTARSMHTSPYHK